MSADNERIAAMIPPLPSDPTPLLLAFVLGIGALIAAYLALRMLVKLLKRIR